jgi:dTDP-4-amino-4,6-dideoxygalactose transaminase
MNGHRVGVLPPLAPGVWARRPGSRPPFPLEEPNVRVFQRARHGLHRGLQALGLRPGDEILVPAYHHGSEIQALIEAGMRCRYYESGESLAPEPASLEVALGPAARALHLIHYLGFPQDAGAWRLWCDERGLLLIEDAAQAWLSSWQDQPVGSFGDLAIFCAYKSFGVPDGGLVVTKGKPAVSPPIGPREFGLRAMVGSNVSWLAARMPAAVIRRRTRPTLPGTYDPSADFALGNPDSRAAVVTTLLLQRLRWERTPDRRRRNYRYLMSRLPPSVQPMFPRLPDGAVPFALPIRTEDKHSMLETLDRHDVSAFDLWSVPHPTLRVADFPNARLLRESVVALPVHQELTASELDRIAEAVSVAMVR